MNKSSLDSGRVNGGKEEDGGRDGILPEFKLLFSSSDAQKSHYGELH